MDILDELVKIRKEKKVTQADMLGVLGITGITLSRYESGKRSMPLSVTEKYLDYLGYEIKLQRK